MSAYLLQVDLFQWKITVNRAIQISISDRFSNKSLRGLQLEQDYSIKIRMK